MELKIMNYPTTNQTCPECDGPMWDQRKSKWWGNGIGKSGKPKPVFKCKDKECDGVIWPDDVDDYDDEPDAPAPRPAARRNDPLIEVATRIAAALEQISQRLSELKWTAPLSKEEVTQYEYEAHSDEDPPF